jgi:precorrin-6A synthase
MGVLHLVGIGTGNPDHLTLEAVAILNAVDLIVLQTKGHDKADLADLRREILARVLTHPVPVAEFEMPERDSRADYLDAVDDWHAQIAERWAGVLDAHLPAGGSAALMVWGDPSLYDSSLRIAARLRPEGRPLAVRVVPGITSLQALTAAHAIPLNDLGAPVVITTGRRLRAEGWPPGADTVAVMLDSGGAYEAIDPEGVEIWWGACLGLAGQALRAGPLAEVGPEIRAARAEVRARMGWVMDVYLMRRRRHGGGAG